MRTLRYKNLRDVAQRLRRGGIRLLRGGPPLDPLLSQEGSQDRQGQGSKQEGPAHWMGRQRTRGPSHRTIEFSQSEKIYKQGCRAAASLHEE